MTDLTKRDPASTPAGVPVGTPAGAPLLEVEHLRKTYGDRVVLDDISLTVRRHEVICLIGSSGSGKSTLLRCLDLL